MLRRTFCSLPSRSTSTSPHSLLPSHHLTTTPQPVRFIPFNPQFATKLSPHSSQVRSLRRRPRDLDDEPPAAASKPDTDAYINQQQHLDFMRKKTASQPNFNPNALSPSSLQPYANLENQNVPPPQLDNFFGELRGERQQQTAPRPTFTQTIKKMFSPRQFMAPSKLEDDVPMIVVKDAKKKGEKEQIQLFLPVSNHPWTKLTDVPEIVSIARKDLSNAFFMYGLMLTVLVSIRNLPIAIDLTKDAEKKHIALQKEVAKEEKYLSYLHNMMTLEEIHLAMEPLPRKPGQMWNPEEDEEQERLRRRLFYPA